MGITPSAGIVERSGTSACQPGWIDHRKPVNFAQDSGMHPGARPRRGFISYRSLAFPVHASEAV
jgi:hypothetical protein